MSGRVPNAEARSQEAIESDRAERGMERCPGCNYSLHSLPAAYRCPECGLEFDEYSRVWRPKNWTRMLGFGTGFLGLFCIVKLISGIRRGTTSPRFWIAIATILILVGVSCYALIVFRRRPCVAVTPRGLLVRLGWGMNELIAWSDVRSFKFGISLTRGGDKSLYVKTTRGKFDLTAVSRGVGVAERLSREIEQARDHYLETAPRTGTVAPIESVHDGRRV